MNAFIDLRTIDSITKGKIGTHDIPCPICGPERRSLANQRRKVLRVWQLEPTFATYHCARCGEHGHVRDGGAAQPDSVDLDRVRREAAERECAAAAERLSRARWLWSKRRPLAGSIAEMYLREARGYTSGLPATLGFLPGRGEYGPALIAAFGLPEEPEPSRLAIPDDAVLGVHLTRLAPNGSGKAGTGADKIMIGSSLGSPIVVAPPNDLLGLAITEGIEDALSMHEATGLGSWAAGSSSRLPALAAAVPDYVETITIVVDDDDEGRRHAGYLAERLRDGGREVRLLLAARDFGRTAA